MITPQPVVSVEKVREAARAYAAHTPLRDFAIEVGIPWSTLRAFLNGAEPRKENRKKLTAWYVRTMTARGEKLTPELARAFLTTMLEGIPAEQRDAAEREVRAVLERVYREAGVKLPEWLG